VAIDGTEGYDNRTLTVGPLRATWSLMMSEQHGKTYRPWEPERSQHEAQSPAAKLPEGEGVFFLLDTVRRLD